MMMAGKVKQQSRALKVTNYIRFLSGIVVGSMIGSPIVVVVAYILSKNIDAYKQIQERAGQQLKKVKIILLGALFGSISGLVFIPILLIFVIKGIDDRLYLPAGSNPFKEFNHKYLLSISEIVLGVVVGLAVNFLDLWILYFCTTIFAIVFFCFIQGAKIQECYREGDPLDPQNSIKSNDQFSDMQYFQNIWFASVLAFYNPSFCFWACLAYTCYFLFMKFYKTASRPRDKSIRLAEKESTNQIQEQLHCLISTQTMKMPAFLKECGHTFERANIQEWLAKKNSCPACNTITTTESIKLNQMLSDFMTKWRRLAKISQNQMKAQ